MTPEERELLHRSVALSEENNNILRGIQRSMRFSRFVSILYWVFIIGSAIGAYYLIQPYVEAVTGAYGDTKSSFSSGVQDALKNFKNISQ
jgi:hypothetical protein